MSGKEEQRKGPESRRDTDAGGMRPVSRAANMRAWMLGSTEALMARAPVQWGMFAILLALLALILGPPMLDSDSLLSKLTVGERAEANIKATRHFVYKPGAEALEKRRAEAANAVPVVYDYRSDLGGQILARIPRAFEELRRFQKAEAPPTKEGESGDSADSPVDKLRKRFSAALKVDISRDAFERLRLAESVGDMSSALINLVGSAMNQLVAVHRGILTGLDGRSITVRYISQEGHDGVREEKLSNLSSIRDMPRVREQMRQQINLYGAKLKTGARKDVLGLAYKLVGPNLVANPDETGRRKASARQAILPAQLAVSYTKGQIIIHDGDAITDKHRHIVLQLETGYQGQNMAPMVVVGMGLLACIFLIVVYRFGTRQFFGRRPLRPRDMMVMGLLLLGLLGLTKAFWVVAPGTSPDTVFYSYMLPIAAGAMLVHALISAEAAALFAVVLSTMCGLLLDKSLSLTLFYLVTSLVGASGMSRLQSRGAMLRAGLLAGTAGAAMVICLHLLGGQFVVGNVLYCVLSSMAGGLLAAFATLALLPVLEWFFSYTTDITLLELANLNHPLVRELMLKAPGTYHHSMVVGSLAESACDAIDANGLLARVAANFHDVGKMKNAAYFAENFKTSDNPHNRLKPSMSALIIRSHLKDSIEMMREYGIPERVIAVATQHHGRTKIEYFYHKAMEQAEAEEDINIEDYRYPGLTPQTREAGVIMLADGVEAAARSLAEPTVDRLQGVVQRVINARFTDSQLQQCDLTLRDLHKIAKSFLQVLSGIYHQRPTYPWQRGEEGFKVADGSSRPKRSSGALSPVVQGDGQKGKTRQRKATTDVARESNDPGAAKAASEPITAEEDSEESSPDIKRLGLN
jgi:cyclic-di-AMP phosphodiesterase PgpH